jgi:hypothetical protein
MGTQSSKYANYIKKAFDTLDKNHDGKITVEELQVGTFCVSTTLVGILILNNPMFKKAKIVKLVFVSKNSIFLFLYQETLKIPRAEILKGMDFIDKNKDGWYSHSFCSIF